MIANTVSARYWRELWKLVKDAEIKDALADAQKTVKPIVDEEREGENIGDLMNLRLDAAASTEAQDAEGRCDFCKKQTWVRFCSFCKVQYCRDGEDDDRPCVIAHENRHEDLEAAKP